MNSGAIHLVCIAARFRDRDVLYLPPYGILHVGTALKKAGFPVVLHHIPSREMVAAVKRIVADRPMMVGFSIFTGFPVRTSVEMSESIKASNPQTPIVWGGIHPSAIPIQCLAEPSVDYVVIGEGEEAVVELARCLSEGRSPENVAGLGCKVNGEARINPSRPFIRDLDACGVDWSLLPPENYVGQSVEGKRTFAFFTSRGCSGACGFCYNLIANRRTWRAHSVEHVVSEVLEIQRRCGITDISFNDDHFFEDEDRALAIIEALRSHGIETQYAQLRVTRIRHELVEQLKALGVGTVLLGWESATDRILKLIRKDFTVDLLMDKIRLLAEYPMIACQGSAVIGFPTETRAELYATIDLALKMSDIHPRICFNLGLYLPYPATPLYRLARRSGFVEPKCAREWGEWDIYSRKLDPTWLPWAGPGEVKRIRRVTLYGRLLESSPRLVTDSPQKYFLKQYFRWIGKWHLKRKAFGPSLSLWLYRWAKKINWYILRARGMKAATS